MYFYQVLLASQSILYHSYVPEHANHHNALNMSPATLFGLLWRSLFAVGNVRNRIALTQLYFSRHLHRSTPFLNIHW
jgi:hypothetical protein